MNKQLLCAAFAGAVATLALAQSPGITTSNGSTDAAAATSVAPMAPADQRAKDLQSSMEIRKWQAGPSAGDQAANINGAADEMTPADKRAADLNAQMEIRSWQSGPSLGDQAARIGDANSQAAPAAQIEAPGLQRQLEQESTQ